jgi:type III secretion system FlhB-like substrate exporter
MQKNSEDHARHVLKVGFQVTAARHVPRAPLVGLEKHKAQIVKHARMGGIPISQKKSLANRALHLHCLKTQEPNA